MQAPTALPWLLGHVTSNQVDPQGAASHQFAFFRNQNPRLHMQHTRVDSNSREPRASGEGVTLNDARLSVVLTTRADSFRLPHPHPRHVVIAAQTKPYSLLPAHITERRLLDGSAYPPPAVVVAVAPPTSVVPLRAALDRAALHQNIAAHCRRTQSASPIAVCLSSSLGPSTPSHAPNSSLEYGSGKGVPLARA